MKGEVPVEVALLLCAAVEAVDEGASRKSLKRVATGVAHVSVMLQGEIPPGPRRDLPQGGMCDPRRAKVIFSKCLHRNAAHVRPEPVAVDFVAKNEVRNTAMISLQSRETVGEKLDAR